VVDGETEDDRFEKTYNHDIKETSLGDNTF
jgi:hypothetical protein